MTTRRTPKPPKERGTMYCLYQGVNDTVPGPGLHVWLDCGRHTPRVRMSLSVHPEASPEMLTTKAKDTALIVAWGYTSNDRKQIVKWALST